jgi:hypothetical protein
MARDWPLENPVKHRVIELLTKGGLFAWQFHATQFGRGGFPDILVLSPGRKANLYELKSPNGRISKRQYLVHQQAYQASQVDTHIIITPRVGADAVEEAAMLVAKWIVENVFYGRKPWPKFAAYRHGMPAAERRKRGAC